MPFSEIPPKWLAAGVEPPESKKTAGWLANDRPPAEYFNWQMSSVYKVLLELQTKAAEKADLTTHTAATTAHGATSAATANRMIQRDSSGRAKVAAPVAADDIARKDTVDQLGDYLQAQIFFNGGGTVTWVNDCLKWTSRFVMLPVDKSIVPSGFIEVLMPAVGTVIPGIGTSASVTVTANGIPLPSETWASLYAEHTPGGSQIATLKIADYAALTAGSVTSNMLLVASRHSDSNVLKLGTGQLMPMGTKIVKGAPSVDAGQIANGSVTNAEFQYLGGVTAPIQAQLENHFGDYVRHPGYAVTTGDPNEYEVTLSPAPRGYTEGMGLVIKIHATNFSNSTINVNGLGVKMISSYKGFLGPGRLIANGVYTLRYNGMAFILQGEGGGEGDAVAGDVVAPKTFMNATGETLTGEIVDNRGKVIDAYLSESIPGTGITVYTEPGVVSVPTRMKLASTNFRADIIKKNEILWGLRGTFVSDIESRYFSRKIFIRSSTGANEVKFTADFPASAGADDKYIIVSVINANYFGLTSTFNLNDSSSNTIFINPPAGFGGGSVTQRFQNGPNTSDLIKLEYLFLITGPKQLSAQITLSGTNVASLNTGNKSFDVSIGAL